jgi:uncharacterized protein YecE (DUF72 family)
MGDVRIGCSGWHYKDWRGVLYPPGLPASRWLERYAEVFDTVEVNSTFYRLASPGAAEQWMKQTPPDFLFTCKASRYLTHMKRLTGLGDGVTKFYAALEPLPYSRKWGPVLWQLPERDQRDVQRLGRALEELPPGRHAFEFRHPSWFVAEVLDLLRAAGVALVIGDHPERPWQPHVLTADFTIIRFHYGHRGRRGNYSRSELEEWATEIRALRADADVFAYFNNDWEGFAVRNARLLQRLVGEEVRPTRRASPALASR